MYQEGQIGNLGNQLTPRTYTATSALQPASGIPTAFSESEQLAEILLQGVGALRDRLESGGVLRPVPPQGGTDSAKVPSPAVSGLVSRINDLRGKQMRTSDIITEILSRLDV